MAETKHDHDMDILQTMFCKCDIASRDPKPHRKWCPYWAAFKDIKPQPKKYQEEAERR